MSEREEQWERWVLLPTGGAGLNCDSDGEDDDDEADIPLSGHVLQEALRGPGPGFCPPSTLTVDVCSPRWADMQESTLPYCLGVAANLGILLATTAITGAVQLGAHLGDAMTAGMPPCIARRGSSSGADREIGLGLDKKFNDKAVAFQEFVHTVGKKLFPEHATSASSMRAFRATLVTSNQNQAALEWWLTHNPQYVGLGFAHIDFDGVFSSPDISPTSPSLGFTDWSSTRIGCCLGQQMWRWLAPSAGHRVLESYLDMLLQRAIDACQEAGGPKLDVGFLRLQFFCAVVVDLVCLLDVVALIYQLSPRDCWPSVVCLEDVRPYAHIPAAQSLLWQAVQTVVNTTAVTSKHALNEFLEEAMVHILGAHMVGAGSLPGSVLHEAIVNASETNAELGGVDVRLEPNVSAPLVVRLPGGTRCATRVEWVGGEWTRIALPVPGWLPTQSLAGHGKEFGCVDLNRSGDIMVDCLCLMYHTRRQYTGYSPRHRCVVSSRMFIEELAMRERHNGMLTKLGLGKPVARLGSFLAEQEHRKWWPEGYDGWAHHTYVVFEDGSIADLTADQWDSRAPRLWFPADPHRYRPTAREADEARAMRKEFQGIGLARWRKFDDADTMVGVTKTRRQWEEIEREHGELGRTA